MYNFLIGLISLSASTFVSTPGCEQAEYNAKKAQYEDDKKIIDNYTVQKDAQLNDYVAKVKIFEDEMKEKVQRLTDENERLKANASSQFVQNTEHEREAKERVKRGLQNWFNEKTKAMQVAVQNAKNSANLLAAQQLEAISRRIDELEKINLTQEAEIAELRGLSGQATQSVIQGKRQQTFEAEELQPSKRHRTGSSQTAALKKELQRLSDELQSVS